MSEFQDREGQIGPEAKYKVEFKGGKATVGVMYDGKWADASVQVSIPAAVLLQPLVDKLKKLIPTQIDDAILDKFMEELNEQ